MPMMKERTELMITTLIISTLIAVGITSRLNKPTTQLGEGASRRTDAKSGDEPSQVRHPSKRDPCAARYYSKVGHDEDNNLACYELQLRLINAIKEGDLERIRQALEDGANPDGSVYGHYPPLHTAAAYGQTDAVRMLLDGGAQVNRVTDFERTPLNLAASNGHTDVIRVLLEKGADVCYRSLAGTAGDVARSQGYTELAESLKTAEATKCGPK